MANALMPSIPRPTHGLRGEVRIPGDKSISHRTLMFSALAAGRSQVSGLLPSADVLSTLGCLTQLGATIRPLDAATGQWEIDGCPRWQEPAGVLDCGNSGTTMRLMSGLVAGQNVYAVMSGDVSLNKRPMARVLTPLGQMGVRAFGREGGRLAPLTFVPSESGLEGIYYTMPVASAQVKSAILLAGLFAKGSTTVVEPLASRDHTERMLRAMGVDVQVEGLAITVQGGSAEALQPLEWLVPGDPSSAAFMAVVATLCPQSEVLLKNVGLNVQRTGLFTALQRIGAKLSIENERLIGGELVGDIRVCSSELSGDLTLNAEDVPALVDEVPILTVACLFLNGTFTLHGADELRKKESDRLLAMQSELAKLGVSMTLYEDGLQLKGNPDACFPTEPSSLLATWHDHRIAMALACLNTIHNARHPQKACSWAMDDPSVVGVSFPSFFEQLASLSQQAQPC